MVDSKQIEEDFELNDAAEQRAHIMRILNSEPDARSEDEVSLLQSIFEDNKFLK